jgi:hypothetical protein
MAAPIGGIVPHHKAAAAPTARYPCIISVAMLPDCNIITEMLP